MSVESLLDGLRNQPFAVSIAEGAIAFPLLETIHVIALTLVVGSIAMVDLRLLGIASKRISVRALSDEVLPWTWVAFIVAATTGFLLFSSNAVHYWVDVWPFRVKMLLLALAGVNMLVFQFVTFRSVANWDRDVPTSIGAKIGALLSLLFWIGIVTCGRWTGFV